MDIVNYLANIYGYDTPIFLKDVRIGRKSKAAIKEEFYRAVKQGKLERQQNGVYFLRSDKEFGSGITFDDVLKNKFFYSDHVMKGFEKLFVEGYYSGLTFLNIIGLSQQVPAISEITTNKTSSKKKYYGTGKFLAIIRKSRTTVTSQNYKMLQFLDMFSFISLDEVKDNRELLKQYIENNFLTKKQFSEYIGFYSNKTIKKIVEGGIINAFI